jgi:hypothetical protein
MYNGQNLAFTGNKNPYALIQDGGKIKSLRAKKTMHKRIKRRKGRKGRKGRKTRKYRR